MMFYFYDFDFPNNVLQNNNKFKKDFKKLYNKFRNNRKIILKTKKNYKNFSEEIICYDDNLKITILKQKINKI